MTKGQPVADQPDILVLSPSETGVPDRLVWRTGPEAGAVTEWWTNEATLGRAPGNTFIVDDPSVSRRHVRLTRTSEGVFLEDLGSGNGTRLDGAKVSQSVRLRDGGLVELGSVSFAFETLVTTVTGPKPKSSADAALRLRRRLLVSLAVMVVLVAAGLVWKSRAPVGAAESSGLDVEPVARSADPVARAEALARSGRWVEAEALLKPVWEGSDDSATNERWALVRRESAHQRRLDEASTRLKEGDLARVDALLAEVPDDAAQVGRRDELRRARDEAARTKAPEAVARPVAQTPTIKAAAEAKAGNVARPAPAKPARAGETNPALAAWLSGDTAKALQLSTDEPFNARVRAVDSAWQAAKAQVQGGNAAEAVRQLATVRRLVADLSAGRASVLGADAAKLFAAQTFQLTLSMKSDEELGRKAVRLAEAVDADPQERYRAAQAENWGRCRELYQQAYVARGPAPDEARQWFRLVCKCLPASDEKQGRACTFAKQLGDAP